MPEYLAPGVYVEEIEMGAKPIEGVSTSTAGFLGETERGPTTPKLVTSWLQYQRIFGSYFGEDKYLPYAVKGFFDNGGKRCYIGRIVKSDENEKAIGATGIIPSINGESLIINAIGEGNWGNNVALRVSEGTRSKPDKILFKLSVYYWKEMPEPVYNPDIDLKSLPRPIVEVFDNISLDKNSSDYYEKKVNGISNFIEISEDKGTIPKFWPEYIGIAKEGTENTVKLDDNASDEDKTYENMQIQIIDGKGKGQIRTIEEYEIVKDENGKITDKIVTVVSNWTTIPDNTTKFSIFWIATLNGGEDALVYSGTAQSGTTDTIKLDENASEKDIYSGRSIKIILGTGKGEVKKIKSFTGNDKVAIVDSDWDENKIPDDTSQFVIYNPNPQLNIPNFERVDSDKPGERKGLTGFAEIDEISIIYSPNAADSSIQGLAETLITHCETLKDRFVIIDAEQSMVNVSEIKPIDIITDTKYAAFYYPWIKIVDPNAGFLRLIPPGGHIAGIYARSDVERGVFKAPANEVVKMAEDLEFQITKGEQDILNPRGVNVIRAFPGRGIRVWGARTMSSDSLWKYINVRRLFIFLEESIDEGTQWVVFEPNDEKLWDRIKQTINQFLTQVWKDGALMGTKPEEAFFVKCDRTTMTQNDIDNGRLIVVIGIAPVKPAEFVIFRIGQWTAGAKS